MAAAKAESPAAAATELPDARRLSALAPPSEVAAVRLYSERAPLQRLDGWPVAVLDAAVVGYSLQSGHSMEMTALCTGVALSIHALIILLSHWSLAAKSFLRFKLETSLKNVDHVFVVPRPHQGLSALVRAARSKAPCSSESNGTIRFTYRNLEYQLREEGSHRNLVWTPREYPVGRPLKDYLGSQGLDDKGVAQASATWGGNEFNIPLPSFKELFIDQLLAPMFVFQLFCMLLFFLDEYWYLSSSDLLSMPSLSRPICASCSLFTLTMLLIIEGTVVKQRLYNVRELRQMGVVDERVYVFRNRVWQRIEPSRLVPGDLCALPRGPVPADVLLLSGTCIVNEAMLTGEAIPQMKEPLPSDADDSTLEALADPKLHVMHRGTEVVQVSPPPKDCPRVRCTVESAGVGYVVKTGFATEQGNLLRTIIGNTDRVSANSMEMAIFILFLLTFAIAASCHVFLARVKTTKKMHKLVVECLLIITAVVPPELPVQLNLAVNNALLKLREKLITCTEPFRIPFAGKLDVCCFDKTGTLTEGSFVVNGVAGLINNSLVPLDEITDRFPATARVLAACHALVHVGAELVGDPLEKITVNALGWTFSRADVATPADVRTKKRVAVKVLKRFYFSSALKRMSTVVSLKVEGRDDEVLSLCKGAPETLKSRFSDLPSDYDETYERHARQGARVLALGYRKFGASASNLTREETDTQLTFAGFLVVSSPIKSDSFDAIRRLKASSHHVVMITGDNPLTACHVAREVGIADAVKEPLILVPDHDKGANSTECVWIDNSSRKTDLFQPNLLELMKKYELCITGAALVRIDAAGHMRSVLPYVSVYARTTPEQKATIITGFNRAGLYTLMCGDGTNDVGALRRAHVGIALTPGHVVVKKKKRSGPKKEDPFASLQEYLPPKLGDAVMAASFTSRNPSVMVVCNVIRQGRCTLVTSTQMLRILALNCLMNSYSMSVLYLRGVKFGDTQLTFGALFVAASMFAVTRSNPLKSLAPQRPASSVLAPSVILSILGQFLLHVGTLSWMVDSACALSPPPEFDPEADPESDEGKFKVSLLNTTVYLISWGFTIATIVVNYNGFPFMQTFWQNTALRRSVLLFGSVTVFAATGMSPSFNEFLELVPVIPYTFRLKLLFCMAFDFGGAWALDAAVKFMFPLAASSKIQALRQ